jgi:hypothetical protein
MMHHMMNHLKVLLILLLLFPTEPARSQSGGNAGSAGAQFLKIGVGARAMGMGGAFGSIEGDATSLAWNPAGIGTIEHLTLAVQHTAWVADMNHEFIGVVIPVTEQFSLGLHTVILSSGNIEVTTIDEPEGTGNYYDATDLSVGLTSSIRLSTQLILASTVKYIEERISDVRSDGLAVDVGASYETGFRSLKIGFGVSQLGLDQTFTGRSLEVRYDPATPGEPAVKAELAADKFQLPLTFRAGGSFDVISMFSGPSAEHRLIAAMDFIQYTDVAERVALGVEYSWQNTLFLRAGNLFNADELSWGLGAGVALSFEDVRVDFDYAASSLGVFGIGHRAGLQIEY